MLTIRLSRKGQRNRPMYRLIISENAKDPYDRPLEFLGSYNPYSKELDAKEERIRYWLSQGAGMSPTVNNLLISKNVIEDKKVKVAKSGKGEQQTSEGKESGATKEISAEQEKGTTAKEESGEEAPAEQQEETVTEEKGKSEEAPAQTQKEQENGESQEAQPKETASSKEAG